jgi:hypothetical protein
MAAALACLERPRAQGIPWANIIGGLQRYIREKPPDRQWLNPKTFIVEERWNDKPANTNGKHEPNSAERAAHRALELEALERAGVAGSAPDAIGGDEIGGDHAWPISRHERS